MGSHAHHTGGLFLGVLAAVGIHLPGNRFPCLQKDKFFYSEPTGGLITWRNFNQFLS